MSRSADRQATIGLCRSCVSCAVAALGAVAAVASADVLTLKDGREFEGRSIETNGETVQFETVLSGIRATLSFKQKNVKSLETKPLPPGLFESAERQPATAPAVEAAALYLEIPVRGRFREMVFASAIRSALARAKLNKVKHIVFTVDSPGGDIDEAAAIYKTLDQFRPDCTYHCIIQNCTGSALVVPFLSETIHFQTGATIGGSDSPWETMPRKYASQEEQVVRAQIAEDLSAVARRRGRKGELIKAMIDPAHALAAWVDENGEIASGPRPPDGLPAERLIFETQPGAVLVLSFEQIRRLGAPAIGGGPEKMGALLGLAGWREESSYGRDTMNKAIASRQRRENSAQAKFEDEVTSNIRMREATKRAIEHNLKEAALWNPTDASYQSISKYWNAYWDPDVTWDTHVWTPESRRKWQSRTDACLYYLTSAKSGIESMAKLDKKAVSLGLSPTFNEQDLAFMADDVNTKIAMLKRSAGRIGD